MFSTVVMTCTRLSVSTILSRPLLLVASGKHHLKLSLFSTSSTMRDSADPVLSPSARFTVPQMKLPEFSSPYKHLTVISAAENTVHRVPTKTAVIFPVDGIRKTFRELWSDSEKLAAGLITLQGLKPGDTVAIYAPTCYQWLVAKYATIRLGLIFVPINSIAHPDELQFILEHTRSRALFIGDRHKFLDYYDVIKNTVSGVSDCRLLETDGYLRYIISFANEQKPGTLRYADLVSMATQSRVSEVYRRSELIGPTDPAAILQSSGSTGKPKSIVLTHSNLVHGSIQNKEAMGLPDDAVVLAALPLYHSFGFVCIEGLGMLTGITNVFPTMGAKPQQVLKLIEEEKCSAFHGTPTTYYDLIHSGELRNYNISTLKYGTIGATTLHRSVVKEIIDIFGFTNLKQGYGLTETSAAMSYGNAIDFKGYIPFPGSKFRVVDDMNNTLEIGAQGEIQIRGPTVFKEYLYQPDVTQNSLSKDGWFSTGDVGCINEYRYLEITGRKSDLIIKGGVNISPAEVEKAILTHEDVQEAHVASIPDERLGEEVCAWIKSHPGRRLTEHQIKQHCSQKLTHLKIPRYVVFVEEFPKTSVGKISKLRIRQEMIKMLNMQEL